MSALTIANTSIHQDDSGRFSLNDLHRAAGGERRHDPSEWMSNKQTKELIAELETTGIPVVKKEGRYGGTYVAKEMVYAYAMWISAAFHLQVIRSYDAISAGQVAPQHTASALSPAKEFTALFKIAKLIGMDKNAAAISANQGVAKLTGTNVLALLGHEQLEAENQDSQFFTPTELGERMGLSGRKLNLLLAEAGFQMKRGDVWEVLDAGREFARIYDTGKKHGSGVPIQQIKWAAAVLPILQTAVET